MGWNFYNASGELQINDGGVQASAAVFTGNVDLGSNLLVGNGGSTGIAISANGEVTMAAQPSVLAYNSSVDSNVTGNGAWVTVDFDTEVHDRNADFASDTFTAPVAGIYLLTTTIKVSGITSSGTINWTKFVTSNRDIATSIRSLGVAGFTEYCFTLTMLADMDASDTVYISFYGAGESGNVWDIEGESWISTGFGIHLVA